MTKKSLPLLVTDDIALDLEREKRSNAVKTCAGVLAQKLGTSIDLVHVENLLLYPVKTSSFKPFIDRYFKEQKEKFAAIASSFQIPVKARFINGEPVEKIISLASKRNAYEMIVLGTHGRTGLSRMIAGSVAEEVIRKARIPVMTLGPKAQKENEYFRGPILKLLVPTGLTSNSLRAEEYGVDLARRLGAEVVFFHSIRESLHPVLQTAVSVPNPPIQVAELFKELKETAVKHLTNKVKKAARRRVPAKYVLDDQFISASEGILVETTRLSASLIVIGTHGRSLIQGAFFGRTARDVILGASVPVVTVRSKRS